MHKLIYFVLRPNVDAAGGLVKNQDIAIPHKPFCNDQLLLVTEPTPFGLNDLVLAIQAARLLDKPVAVVVNRYGSGNAMVEEYCKENKIDVVARIPYDMTIAERYSKGGLMLDKHCFRSVIAGIFNYLERKEANRRRR